MLNISATTDQIFLKFQTFAQETKSKLKMLEMETTSKWRRPQTIKYLSNHLSDLPQIKNLGPGDQIKIENAWNEEDLQWKKASKY